MRRCYNDKDFDYRSYGKVGVKVCDEWHSFYNFEKWYLDNYYEIDGEYVALDKDILVKHSRLYSPETCLIVPFKINGIFVHKSNGNMRGIRKVGNKYEVKIRNPLENSKNMYFGRYDDVETAQKVYNSNKESIIKSVAEYYKGRIPEKVYNALIDYKL